MIVHQYIILLRQHCRYNLVVEQRSSRFASETRFGLGRKCGVFVGPLLHSVTNVLYDRYIFVVKMLSTTIFTPQIGAVSVRSGKVRLSRQM